MKKKIFVFALWGDDSKYWIGAKNNISIIRSYFPEFICRFYVDKNCPDDLVNSILLENVEVVKMNPVSYNFKNLSNRFDHSGLFWRFLPLSEDDVEVVLSRDCDSRITERESLLIKEWLVSDKDFHIIRDHPYHTVPILAGLWGAKNGILRNINQLLYFWSNYEKKGVFSAEDQDFLGQVVYPLVKSKSLEHSEFGINFGNTIHKIPHPRKNYEFIGDVFDESDNRHPNYWEIIERIDKK